MVKNKIFLAFGVDNILLYITVRVGKGKSIYRLVIYSNLVNTASYFTSQSSMMNIRSLFMLS